MRELEKNRESLKGHLLIDQSFIGWGHGGPQRKRSRDALLQLFVLHSTILKPDFDLFLVQHQLRGQLGSPLIRKIWIDSVLVLKSGDLILLVWLSLLLSLVCHRPRWKRLERGGAGGCRSGGGTRSSGGWEQGDILEIGITSINPLIGEVVRLICPWIVTSRLIEILLLSRREVERIIVVGRCR